MLFNVIGLYFFIESLWIVLVMTGQFDEHSALI